MADKINAAGQEVNRGEAETAEFSSRVNQGHTVSDSPYKRSEITAPTPAAPTSEPQATESPMPPPSMRMDQRAPARSEPESPPTQELPAVTSASLTRKDDQRNSADPTYSDSAQQPALGGVTSNAELDALVERLCDWTWLAGYANAGWNLPPVATNALRKVTDKAASAIVALRQRWGEEVERVRQTKAELVAETEHRMESERDAALWRTYTEHISEPWLTTLTGRLDERISDAARKDKP